MAIAEPRLLDYLGRGVDCRKPPETWLDALDKYSAEKIRTVHENNENIEETQCQKNKRESVQIQAGRKMNVHASMHVKPHEFLKLGGHLKAERCTSNTQNIQTNYQRTRIMKMHDDTSKDPHIITRKGSYYIRYEFQLIEFIMKHIEGQKHQASTKSSGTDKIEDLNGEDAVAKLHDLRARTKSQSCQQLWQMVADACCHFLQRKHTHYVHNIELGASSHKVEEMHKFNTDVSGGLQGKVMDYADAAIDGGFQKESKSANATEETRGRIDTDGEVIVEEVIEAELRPVSDIINTPELKVVMTKLLECYDRDKKSGPFRISCRITSGREHKIYWQVVDNEEIHGTTEENEASNFYTRHTDKGFHIYYLTEGSGTELFVTVQQRDSPLKLTPSTPNKQCFKLKNNTQKKVAVPFRKVDWTNNSPFFIKQPKSLKSLTTRYVTITECGANSKEKVHEDKHSKSMNKPTYTTATNKTLKDRDYHQLMLFYFELTVQELRIALMDVTRPKGSASGPPPPPKPSRVATDSGTLTPGHSRIESDSSMPDKEYPSGQGNIDCAFIELVGKQYVFPLQAKEEDIS